MRLGRAIARLACVVGQVELLAFFAAVQMREFAGFGSNHRKVACPSHIHIAGGILLLEWPSGPRFTHYTSYTFWQEAVICGGRNANEWFQPEPTFRRP